ncbi:biliverdin-producing heme oxygenase [Salinimicrobium sp. CAU 1759]
MMMTAKLKAETQELHDQIEEKNLARQIMDGSIDLETYKLLLLQNYIAYKHTETEIHRFLPNYTGSKHLQLRRDLENLEMTTAIPPKNVDFQCNSPAEALGAAYVVEGSALGGMVLAKKLKNCPALEGLPAQNFFNGDKENLKEWRNFKEQLEHYPFSQSEEVEAIQKAKDTFRFFEKIFDLEFSSILDPAFKNKGQ